MIEKTDKCNIKQMFKSPGAEYRQIAPYTATGIDNAEYDFSGEEISPSRIGWRPPTYFELEQLKDLGFGAIVTQVSPVDSYLNDEKEWEKLKECIKKAKEYGLYALIYDEQGFPSGDAGGFVLKEDPRYEALGLYYLGTVVKKGQPACLNLPDNKVVYLKALPLNNEKQVNLNEAVNVDAKQLSQMVWEAPDERSWLLMALYEAPLFEGTFAGSGWIKEARRYINILDEKAVEAFLRITYDKYYEQLGESFGDCIKGFFTDEVSLMVYREAKPPYVAIPWRYDMPEKFRGKYGYDLVSCLPALYVDAGPVSRKVRCNYYNLVSELCEKAYFKQVSDWCENHGIFLTGHLLMEERLVWHTVMEGDAMKALRHFRIPGMDVLSSRPLNITKPNEHFLNEAPLVGAKTAVSVSHHANRKRTFCETSHFQEMFRDIPVSYEEIRGTYNWQLAMGINLFASLYPANALTHEKWKVLNDYVARISMMLSQGVHVADIAVFYPIASVWANYVPSERRSEGEGMDNAVRYAPWLAEKYVPEVKHIDNAFVELTSHLVQNQRDFDYIHEDVLKEAQTENGIIFAGQEKYKVLILPPMDTISPDAWNAVKSYMESGGTVIGVGKIPIYTTEGDELKAEVTYHVPSLDELTKLLDRILEPDIKVAECEASELLYCHRSLEGLEVYFLANNSFERKSWKIGFSAEGQPQLWNPHNGDITCVEVIQSEKGRSWLEITLDSFDGCLVVFDK
ncbi:MAG TPA: hypothetical protein GXX14_00120 [Clostridiaceae bacterium]|nr:hypothetical protein [Clostridiaceae bacterium]